MSPPWPVRRAAVTIWAIFAITATFVEAIVRIGARALALIASGLEPGEWAALVVVVILFSYFEGYRGIQQRFAPTVVARALDAGAQRGGIGAALLAPLHAVSLVGSERRACIRAWAGVLAIAVAVVAVRALPLRWRGIVDAGICVALSWGLAAILARFAATFRAGAPRRAELQA